MKTWIRILLEILISVLVAVWIVATILQIVGFKGQKLEDLDRSQQGEEQRIIENPKSISDCNPNEVLYTLSGKIRKLNYHAIVEGEVLALGGIYKQTVSGEKFNTPTKGLYISKSISSFVKVAKKLLIENDTAKVWDAKNISKNTWNEEPTLYTYENYIKEYGTDFRELSNYTLNNQTILSSSFVSVDQGVYKYTYTLDTTLATIGYKVNMAKMGNLSSLPEFKSCTLTIYVNENFEPQKIVCEDNYKVAMLGGLDCSSTLILKFDSLNNEITFPE